ncbi:unnamed protein product [Moneuplotes crassus]|uniref:Uncharacterized protein n=1 Tax=Euplotes crassus TaxID=5936 RepID=A0AAD1XTR7_EUPCR|nr:unnamed protein product [Moneuplotes crassus]
MIIFAHFSVVKTTQFFFCCGAFSESTRKFIFQAMPSNQNILAIGGCTSMLCLAGRHFKISRSYISFLSRIVLFEYRKIHTSLGIEEN